MNYKVVDRVRIRGDLTRDKNLRFGVVGLMAAMAGSLATISEVRDGDPVAYKLKEDPGGFKWSEEMFEPVEQFSSGGIVQDDDSRTIVTLGEMIKPCSMIPFGTIPLFLSDEKKEKIGNVPTNDPRYSDMEVTLQGIELREHANEVRDTPTRGTSIFKSMLDSISMRSALEKCISLAVESEFGTKKSTGIESRKDIRKRLLKL